MGYTRELAQYAVQLKYSDIPAEVVDRAKEIALHQWGVQLAGSLLPWSKGIYRYVLAEGGTPESTVLNYGLRTSMVNTAFANGCFGHAFEMDDDHTETGMKGGSVVVPAAFAVAERHIRSGRDLIVAIVAAFEVMTRVCLAVPLPWRWQGHNITGTGGTFGAAIAAAKLLGFDEELMLHSISVAGGHSAGVLERPAKGGGHLKRIYPGMAASSGVRSALLAREGLTGPESMLEGEDGFVRAMGCGDASQIEELTAGLGTEWQIMRVHYKIWAQEGFLQAMTQALDEIVKRHSFAPADVDEIVVGTNRHAHTKFAGVIREPQDLTSAQFSANFSLALFLIKGDAGFEQYTEESLTDLRIVELSQRIRTETDDEVQADWDRVKGRGARVTVRLKSGETFSAKTEMLRPLSAEDVNGKVRGLTNLTVGAEKGERLISMARNLDQLRDVSVLAPLLVA